MALIITFCQVQLSRHNVFPEHEVNNHKKHILKHFII